MHGQPGRTSRCRRRGPEPARLHHRLTPPRAASAAFAAGLCVARGTGCAGQSAGDAGDGSVDEPAAAGHGGGRLRPALSSSRRRACCYPMRRAGGHGVGSGRDRGVLREDQQALKCSDSPEGPLPWPIPRLEAPTSPPPRPPPPEPARRGKARYHIRGGCFISTPRIRHSCPDQRNMSHRRLRACLRGLTPRQCKTARDAAALPATRLQRLRFY